MARLSFLGAAGTVTGSRYLVETDRSRVLVDCGLFQGLKELRLRNWDGLDPTLPQVDAIVLTHAHIDHSGYLPRLVKAGYRGPIFATPPTIDLLGLVLPDAAYLQEEEAAFANRHGYSRHQPALPLFSVEDALATLRLTRPIPYERRTRLLTDVMITLRDAGHLLGSASVELLTGGHRVVFSGDLGRYGGALLHDPVPVPAADILVCESTYGDRRHAGDPLADLSAAIELTQAQGGVLLIPSFALGRTQEVLHGLARLARQRRLPPWPIYVDSPMAIDATTIFLRHPDYHRLGLGTDLDGAALRPPELHFTRTQTDSRQLNAIEGGAIIISASGMATGGRVLHHLRRLLPDARHVVLFAGYQAPGTRGRTLIDGTEAIKMFGELVPVRATVRHSQSFSAHADQHEIMRWLQGFTRPPRATYLVHGEPAAAAALADLMRAELGWTVQPALDGQQVDLQSGRPDGRRPAAATTRAPRGERVAKTDGARSGRRLRQR